MEEAQIEKQLEQGAIEQREVLAGLAERAENVACHLYSDTPTETDPSTLGRRECELMMLHREVSEILAGIAKAAGECKVWRMLAKDAGLENLTAKELAAIDEG